MAQNEFNAPRPISAGGTGATSESAARTALGLGLYDGDVTLTSAEQGQFRANIGAGALAGFRNKLINPDFEITQRGGPFTANGYTLDRWKLINGTGATNSVQRLPNALGEVPGSGRRSLYWERSVAGSSASTIQQPIEGVTTLSGNRVTVTFYANAADPTTMTISLQQFFGTGGTPSDVVGATLVAGSTNPISLTPSMQRFDIMFDLPAVSGKVLGTNGDDALLFSFTRPHNNPNPTTPVRIKRASLVPGDATKEVDPSSLRHIQQEEIICRRYFRVVRNTMVRGDNTSGTVAASLDFSANPMRAAPSITVPVAGVIEGLSTGTGTIASIQSTSSGIYFRYDASGSTIVGGSYAWRNAEIHLSAEL